MLLQFNFENHGPFLEEQTFNLIAWGKDKSHADSLLPDLEFEGVNAIKSAVIFGPNGGGKSSFIDAIHFATSFIRSSMIEYCPESEIPTSPFLLREDAREESSSFEFCFIAEDGMRYDYGFVVCKTEVREEWLLDYPEGKARHLLDRNESGWEFDPQLEAPAYLEMMNLEPISALKKMTRPNGLFMTVAALYNIPQFVIPFNWLTKKLRVFGDFRNYAGYDDGYPAAIQMVAGDPAFRSLLLKWLEAADTGITGIQTWFLGRLVDGESRNAKILRCNVYDIDLKFERTSTDGRQVLFDFTEESAGVRALIDLAGALYQMKDGGGTLFFDDSFNLYHPALTRSILEAIHDKDNLIQVCFSSHDVSLIDEEIFRRDQILFVEKDSKGASKIFSLVEFRNNDSKANWRMKYLHGRYGATPILNVFEMNKG